MPNMWRDPRSVGNILIGNSWLNRELRSAGTGRDENWKCSVGCKVQHEYLSTGYDATGVNREPWAVGN